MKKAFITYIYLIIAMFCCTAPHSPRRQKLNLRMKSLSLDSPESTEHAQRRRHATQSTCLDPQSSHSSSSRIQCKQKKPIFGVVSVLLLYTFIYTLLSDFLLTLNLWSRYFQRHSFKIY